MFWRPSFLVINRIIASFCDINKLKFSTFVTLRVFCSSKGGVWISHFSAVSNGTSVSKILMILYDSIIWGVTLRDIFCLSSFFTDVRCDTFNHRMKAFKLLFLNIWLYLWSKYSQEEVLDVCENVQFFSKGVIKHIFHTVCFFHDYLLGSVVALLFFKKSSSKMQIMIIFHALTRSKWDCEDRIQFFYPHTHNYENYQSCHSVLTTGCSPFSPTNYILEDLRRLCWRCHVFEWKNTGWPLMPFYILLPA